jgi:glycosyltransferase involved in cell wall biosynthesis
MIKVLHVVDKFGVKGSSVHGVSRLFSWWIPRFDKDQFDVRLIGLRRADEACANLRQQGIDVISLNKGKFDFSTITEIVKIVRQQKVDILHLHGYGATNFGRIAAKITKVKNIVHEHFVDPAMPIYQVPFDYLLSQASDFGIAVSNSVKQFMVKKRFLPEEKVKVVFNGAPLRDFKAPSRKVVAAERKNWGIPHDCKIIASIGRLDEQKGNQYFIDAAAKIINKFDNVKFMIIGDGPLMIKLKQRCGRYRIDKDVIFTGYQPDIPLIQSVVDIQVFPSLWEGTPLTVFEAMSMKRAIVSTDVDGLGEVLRHGENALLVPARDSKGLAHAIEDLLAHPYKAERLAAQAELDSYKFDIQKTVDQIQQIYNEIIMKR